MALRARVASVGWPAKLTRMCRPAFGTGMRGDGGVVSAASLRTDLELARQEIRDLRAERDKLRETIRRQLGQQLDTISTKDLTTRIGDADPARPARPQPTARHCEPASPNSRLTSQRPACGA
jgi:outer membrane protein TolC